MRLRILLGAVALAWCCCVADAALLKSSSSSPNTAKRYVPGDSSKVYILDESSSNHTLTVRAALQKRGWTEEKKTYHPQFNLKWTWLWERCKVTSDEQWANHFPNSAALTCKDSLYDHLKATYPMDIVNTIIPPTFALSRQKERQAFIRFASINSASSRNAAVGSDAMDLSASLPNHSGVFVAKPAKGARGQDIAIFRDAQELLDFVDNSTHPYVAQEYLHPPLLFLNKHKFDLRIFLLVTSVSPMDAFVYSAPYARICSGVYSTHNLSDPYVHLTNHQVQKHSDLGEVTPSNQLSPKQLRQVIAEHKPWERFWPTVEKLLARALMAWPKSGHRPNTFELVGADVLIDADLHPWLVEINRAPGLHMITPVVREIYPRMIDEMFAVIFEEKDKRDLPNLWHQIVRKGEIVDSTSQATHNEL